MRRMFLSWILVMGVSGAAAAQDKDKSSKGQADTGQKATISKVDAKNHTVTVKMKDKTGKEAERTFKLMEDMRYLDSTGRTAAVELFRSGDYVLVVEAEGRLRELRQSDDKKNPARCREFVRTAAEIDIAETKLGKLAQDHAASAAIKKFAERMVTDHSRMNKELRDLAQKKGVTLPDKLDANHQKLMDQLSKMQGSKFDHTFAKDMVSGHEKAIEKFEAEAKNGQDSDVKAWAERWLPTLREHLKMARAAAKDVKTD